MARTRRSVTSIAAVAVAAAVALGVGGAIAQGDDAPTGSSPDDLLERLALLEAGLPGEVFPTGVTLDAETSFATFEGDATSVRAVLDTLEPDLRQLFIDADDADGEVAEAVSLVAQGWLDVWTGSASIGAAESHDLAFPMEATDDFGVAAGADDLRGSLETGLSLVLQGRERHLEGYDALRELNPAEPAIQAQLDDRARAARTFDEEIRPLVLAALGETTTSVMVPTERFTTDAPGVQSRATSMTVTCIDRAAYDEAIGELTGEELQAALAAAEVQRLDCPEGLDEYTVDAED